MATSHDIPHKFVMNLSHDFVSPCPSKDKFIPLHLPQVIISYSLLIPFTYGNVFVILTMFVVRLLNAHYQNFQATCVLKIDLTHNLAYLVNYQLDFVY